MKFQLIVRKKFKVYSTESRPWGQGFITVRELSEAGIDVTLIIDSAVTMVMDHVTRIFVGADTVSPDGSLYNKIGTAQIATIAMSVPRHTNSNLCTWIKKR